jgi:hypothetical protein
MTEQRFMPDRSVDLRLLGNLRRSRLEMEELGLQFDEVLAKFDEEIRQQKGKRIQNSLNVASDRSVNS